MERATLKSRLSTAWWIGALSLWMPAPADAVPPLGEPIEAIELRSGELVAHFRDNSQSPRVLSGLQSLYHRTTPDFDAFDPDATGSSAGLNFEHIISGHEDRSNNFTPRSGAYPLYRINNEPSVRLVRRREDSPWDVSSSLTYTLVAPHYIDFHFRCRAHTQARFGPRGHAIFFFANYMNDVADPAIHFRGIASAGDKEVWIRADAPPGHPDWKRGGTYRHRDAPPVEYDEVHNAKLNSWSYDTPRYTRPFYYGRAANDMVLILMFDRAHTADDQIRFSLFKFKLPNKPRPAWDFQFVIHRVVENQEYGFRGRLVWKPWVSRDDCLAEFTKWRRSL